MIIRAPCRTCLLLLMLGLVPGCQPRRHPPALSAQDSTAIEGVRAQYVRAWLSGDTSGVLATLDPDAVLLPPGRLPVIGKPAIRAFWWPTDGSRTTVTAFTWTLEELNGTPRLAFTRGVSALAWRYEKDSTRAEKTTRSVTLTILAPGSDGRWRILRQMWGPPLPG